ncbi:iron ABC transporter permease [Lactobacillus sp. CC-MHH1034]|uniref:FecCD family ABC transporter permease n=1 Tax=Agrilactobacillus fermenti TaxID=2586909 RepID=UPI001E519CA8|nr:iron ABC transporter permease [Agrilactobacillus fermenti]MCD2255513.1 iron ABC transporter permease [Agrilactobacillus fermenti]
MRKNRNYFLISLCILGLLLFMNSLLLGVHNYALSDFFASQSQNFAIIWQLRLPRVLAAAIVGALLALAGKLLQTVSNNPIADPSLLGINSGANLALICGTILGVPFTLFWRVSLAFLGAFLTFLIVFLLSMTRRGLSPTRLILSGTIFSGFLNGIAYGISILTKSSQRFRNFLVGGFSGVDCKQMWLLLILLLIILGLTIYFARDITIIGLNDQLSQGLGSRIVLIRSVAVIIVVLATSGSVAVGGNIAFIGLGIPHLVHYFDKRDFKHVYLEIMCFGSVFLMFCDLLARLLARPFELPLGGLSAILGGGFLIWYVYRQSEAVVA